MSAAGEISAIKRTSGLGLYSLHAERPITALMHGGASGVDTIAAEWARSKPGIARFICRADWQKHGKAAGPLRNARMFEWSPDLVVAFPGGRGTADMIRRAQEAGVELWQPGDAS